MEAVTPNYRTLFAPDVTIDRISIKSDSLDINEGSFPRPDPAMRYCNRSDKLCHRVFVLRLQSFYRNQNKLPINFCSKPQARRYQSNMTISYMKRLLCSQPDESNLRKSHYLNIHLTVVVPSTHARTHVHTPLPS